jgi:hypothetical protein
MVQIETSDNFDIGTIPIEKLILSTSGFNLVDALLFIQKVNTDLRNYIHKKVLILSPQVPNYSNKWFLITTEANAFISKYLINYSSEINYKKYDAHRHFESTIYYHHLETDLHYLNSKDEEAYKWCIRAMNQQFHYLRIPNHIMGRYLILFTKIKLVESDEINQITFEEFGLRPQDIMLIGMSMYTVILQNKVLNLEHIINHTIESPIMKSLLTVDNINKFLDIYSIDVESFRRESLKWKIPKLFCPLYKYEFNPIWSYPIIKTKRVSEPDNKYIVPSLIDLIFACSEGIYYKLMDKFRKNNSNKFSEIIGKYFQEYIGYLLRELNIDYEKCDDAIPNAKPKPDYLIKEENKIIQIEVKKRIMSNETRACVDNQLEDYINKLSEDIYRQLFLPSQQYSCYMVYNVIIALDEWYYFEEKIKTIIENKLKKKAEEGNVNITRSKFKFHLLGCTEFEILCQFIKDKKEASIFDLLREKEEEVFYYKSISELLEEKYHYQATTISFTNNVFDEIYTSILN